MNRNRRSTWRKPGLAMVFVLVGLALSVTEGVGQTPAERGEVAQEPMSSEGAAATVGVPEGETCHLCVNYSGTGGTWHFWPDWGGGVCPDPEEQNNCQMKPGLEEVGMPGYEGACPTDGCPPHEEQEQAVAGAIADQNVDLLVKLLMDEPDSYTFAPEGGAIQLRACNGTVFRSFALPRAVAEELRFQLHSVP